MRPLPLTAAPVLLLASGLACADHPSLSNVAPGVEAVLIENIGLENPRAILHDPVADVYLIANAGFDGNGFITRLAPNGKVLQLRWLDGARTERVPTSPRGLGIRGEILFVADESCLHRFGRESGEAQGAICPPSVGVLSDVTVDPVEGAVYVLDQRHHLVFAITPDSAAQMISTGMRLGGLSFSPTGIFGTGSEAGGLYRIRPDTVQLLLATPGKRLGSLVVAGNGSFAFANLTNSTVHLVEARGNGTRAYLWTLIRDVSEPGSFGYDGRRQRILVPQIDGNSLLFVGLGPN